MSSVDKPSKCREFDFGRHPKRRIAIMFLYLGWEFDGLVTQTDTENTVEEHIFKALLKTKLIESRGGCEWTRCGRTDKGVSAFKQVASLIVRSSESTDGYFWPEVSAVTDQRVHSSVDLPYIKMLNGVLPKAIRILAFANASREFSARFNCSERVYTYVLPRAKIQDVSRLNEACNRLNGTHDFRNFCHIDRNKSRLGMSYTRTINAARVETLSRDSAHAPFDLLKLTVSANGFLWHQIRCIVALLYEIGCGNEEPEIINEMFDIDKFPSRPQYKMASELPLVLLDCNFPEDLRLDWKFDTDSLVALIATLQKQWAIHQIRATNIKAMLNSLNGMIGDGGTSAVGLDEFVRSGQAGKNYVPLPKRPRCTGLEERRTQKKTKEK